MEKGSDMEDSTEEKMEFEKCIFLGRGSGVQRCPGNAYFRNFVYCFRERYESNPKKLKKHVITGVIRLLEMDGYRFLKYKGGSLPKKNVKTRVWIEESMEDWEDADEGDKYSKVAHSFRTGSREKSDQTEKAQERATEHQTDIDEAYERLVERVLSQPRREVQMRFRVSEMTTGSPLLQMHERTEVTRRLVKIILGERETSGQGNGGMSTS